jgi:hydrogenase maturation protease
MVGYDSVFLIDAMITTESQPGELTFIRPDEISLPTLCSHGFNLLEILKLGKKLGLSVPQLKWVYGITIGRSPAFGEEPSSQLMGKVEAMAAQIADHVKKQLGG